MSRCTAIPRPNTTNLSIKRAKNMISLGITRCFSFDFDKKVATFDIIVPEVVLKSDYEINGKILLLPVYGKGLSTIQLSNYL